MSKRHICKRKFNPSFLKDPKKTQKKTIFTIPCGASKRFYEGWKVD